ncbi:hypothetical protein Hamer_G017170 [Homarus americanus]|uniref:Uncharacterized protein n=1 Tax=Homarus americanus TaxID=6706 RepID=A0A8J5K576_HOMAM|nr:hypothetical protein Hamer_G017170 [Homarus americanus]
MQLTTAPAADGIRQCPSSSRIVKCSVVFVFSSPHSPLAMEFQSNLFYGNSSTVDLEPEADVGDDILDPDVTTTSNKCRKTSKSNKTTTRRSDDDEQQYTKISGSAELPWAKEDINNNS